MNVIFTVLFAFALGYAVRQRGLAVVAYLALDAVVLSFQTVSVLLSWMADQPPVAFGPSPRGGFPIAYSGSELLWYGLVNVVTIAVGVGLVVLGGRVARRRTARRDAVSAA